MKFSILLSLVFFSIPAFAEVAPICGKAWTAPAEFNSGVFQNGQFFDIVQSGEPKKSLLRIKDFSGKIIREVSLPRNPSSFSPQENLQNGVIYEQEGKLFHFDYLNSKEVEVLPVTPSGAYVYEMDKSSLVRSYSNVGANVVFDTKTQKKIIAPSSDGIEARGQTVAFVEFAVGESFTKFSIHNFESDKTQTFDVPKSKYIQFVNEKFIRIHRDGNEEILDDKQSFVNINGKWTNFPAKDDKVLSAVLSSGELVFSVAKHKKGKKIKPSSSNYSEFDFTTEVYDKTGKTKTKVIKGIYIQSLTGTQNILKVDYPGTLSTFTEGDFLNIASGKDIKSKLVVNESISPTSENGEWGLLSSSAKNASYLMNLKNGKTFKVPYVDYADIKISDNKENILIAAMDSKFVVNTTSGKVRSFGAGDDLKFDKNFNKWFKARDQREVIGEVCFPNSISVIDDDCNCLFRNTENDPKTLTENLNQIQEIALKSLCQDLGNFDHKKWDELTPAISKGEVSEKQAILYLKRFQKKDGFDLEKHLPILSAILNSKLVEKEPALVNEVLKSFSKSQPLLLRSIYNVLKIDHRLPKIIPSNSSVVCRNAVEAGVTSFAIDSIKAAAANQQIKNSTEAWLVYKPFVADIKKLPKSEKNAVVDGIAETMSVNAVSTPELDGVFQSKIYYFAKKWALDFIGEPTKPATDLAISIRGGETVPIALGSGEVAEASAVSREDEIDGKNAFGFSFKTFDPIKISETAKTGSVSSKKVSWQHDGKPFSADAKITVLEPLSQLISKDPSPDYAALKRDGKLTGMMIVGNNLSSGNSKLVDEYLTYYQNEGFQFKPAQSVDAIALFQKSIKTGELDYLIKEAHSDGDERNLFRANRYGILLEGTLVGPDGINEVIYLLVPDEERTDSKLISNQEFGSWIRSRGKNEPLIYLNASCSSARKVISEIAAAHSKNFVPIPSDSTVLTFVNFAGNGTRSILEGLRDGKDYPFLRRALEQTANFMKGMDKFIFPDEKAYEEQIRKNLKMNLDVELTVKDGSGKEVHIDENIDHDR